MIGAALARIRSGYRHLDLHQGPGFMSEAINTAEGMGASWGYGYLHGLYRDQMVVPGTQIPINLAAGVVGKIVAIGLDVMTPGRSRVASHVNAVANAGLYTYAFSDGVGRGTRAAGRKIYLLEAGKTAPAALGDLKQTDVVGEIPQATGGDYLTPETLRELARQR